MFYPIDLAADIPLFISLGIISFVAVSILTPKLTKHGAIAGWFFAELLEHLVLPMVFILFAVIFPVTRFAVSGILIFGFYGRIIGDAKSTRDWFQVFLLYAIFIGMLYTPTFLMMWQYWWGMEGYRILIPITAISILFYIYWIAKKKIKKKK